MGILMTDMAAGSTAARQMNQNIIGAQYDAQNAAADAEARQLKNQYEKVAIDKAKADVQKETLTNVLLDGKIKLDSEKQSIIKGYLADPTTKDKDPADQMKDLAARLAAVDPANAAHLANAAANLELKSANAALKQQDAESQKIGKAVAALEGTHTPEQVRDVLSKMPDEQKKLIQSQIPGFFEEIDPQQQKEQLKALMLNAKGQLQAAQIASREEIARKQMEMKERIAKNHDLAMIARLIHGEEGKDARAAAKSGEKDWKTINSQSLRVDHEYSRQVKEADDAVKKAERDVGTSRIMDIVRSPEAIKAARQSGEAWEKYKDAWRTSQDIKKERDMKQMKLVENAPESPAKDKMMKYYEDLLVSYENDKPPDPVEAKSKASGKVDTLTKPVAVPSNKAADTKGKAAQLSGDDKQALDWANANPNDPRAAKIKQKLGM
jgi:hypothetical protein